MQVEGEVTGVPQALQKLAPGFNVRPHVAQINS